jgi:hypothetical protein
MIWSHRVTKKLSCPKTAGSEMTCSMDLESYGYSADELFYTLKEGEKPFIYGRFHIAKRPAAWS